MNTIALMGRLTADTELKQTQNGISVCSFTLAVKRPNSKDTTDFINCVAWRNTAEFICSYFRKGNMIALNGILTSRKFQDQNGKNHVAFEVLVDRAEFCESKKKDDATPSTAEDNTEPTFDELSPYDDVPF